jgi:RNA polymerase sigma factor (sigma-70 family)
MVSTNRAMDLSELVGLAAPSALPVKYGKTGAPETWYRAHAERLFSTICCIIRNHEDAEDAVQDTFLSAFQHLHNFQGRSAFSTWLTRIGVNSALMILRKKRNSREVSAQDASEGDTLWQAKDSAPDPEEQYADQERRRLLRQAIANLRPSMRRPLQLQTLYGYSAEKVASEIGLSVSAAKTRLLRAKAALRKSRVLRNTSHRDVRGHVGVTPSRMSRLDLGPFWEATRKPVANDREKGKRLPLVWPSALQGGQSHPSEALCHR